MRRSARPDGWWRPRRPRRGVSGRGWPRSRRGPGQRLLTRLGALAAQAGAEVTVVFDGAALDGPTPTGSPRGVRTLFSPPGTTADTVIRRLVRAEPAGRAVIVVSSDREVSDGV